MAQSDEPLDPQSWVEAITRLNTRVASDPNPSHFARHLRNAYALSRLAPAALFDIFAAEPTEAEYEQFLLADDLYKASIELLNPELKLVIVKPDGTVKLEIHAPIFGALGAANDEFPRGIVLAWTKCVMEVAALANELDEAVSHPAPRIPRSGQHPQSN